MGMEPNVAAIVREISLTLEREDQRAVQEHSARFGSWAAERRPLHVAGIDRQVSTLASDGPRDHVPLIWQQTHWDQAYALDGSGGALGGRAHGEQAPQLTHVTARQFGNDLGDGAAARFIRVPAAARIGRRAAHRRRPLPRVTDGSPHVSPDLAEGRQQMHVQRIGPMSSAVGELERPVACTDPLTDQPAKQYVSGGSPSRAGATKNEKVGVVRFAGTDVGQLHTPHVWSVRATRDSRPCASHLRIARDDGFDGPGGFATDRCDSAARGLDSVAIRCVSPRDAIPDALHLFERTDALPARYTFASTQDA
jgi:hypothetical protein